MSWKQKALTVLVVVTHPIAAIIAVWFTLKRTKPGDTGDTDG